MRNANMTIALQHTGAFGVLQSRNIEQLVPYSQSVSGTIDVASGTSSGTAFALALGTIGNVTGFMILNNVGQEVGVRLNNSITDQFHVADGGTLTFGLPEDLTTGSITSIQISTTDTVAADGYIEYVALGTTSTASVIGSCVVYRVTSNPEGSQVGNIGDLAIDTVGGLLYIKNTGTGTSTGWLQFSTI